MPYQPVFELQPLINLGIGGLPGSLTTSILADRAVTRRKIDFLAVGEAQIDDLAVTDAKINTLSATKLTAGTINTGQITLASLLRSSNFVAGTSGFSINGGTGNAEFNNVTVRGTIHATAGTIGNLTVDDTITMGTGGIIKTGSSGERLELTNSTSGLVTIIDSGNATAGVIGISEGLLADTIIIRALDSVTTTRSVAILHTDALGNNTVFRFSNGQVLFPDGTEGSPAYSFANDVDSGMHRVAANQFGLSANGNTVISWMDDQATNRFLRPGADNIYKLGQSGRRWTEVWAVDGSINTSDAREKRDITDITGPEALSFLSGLRPRYYKWNWGKRTHMGFITQELDLPGELAVWVDPAVSGEEGVQGLRYTELIAPLVAAVQEMAARIEVLEERVALCQH